MSKHPALRKLFHDKWGMAALAVCFCFVLTAVGVEIYDSYCRCNGIIPAYNRSSAECYAPPSSDHIFGTDYQGRDVFARCAAGWCFIFLFI